MLKELLERDFGLVLDISGGTGQSKNDPIHILSNTINDALYTESLVLRGLGKGRGILWRTLSVEYVDGTEIIQRKIETKEVRKDEIISQVENYYFSRLNTKSNGETVNSQLVASFSAMNGVEYPYEISWLHCDGVTDYRAKEREDLGCSLAYGAPGIKATIYIYPKVSSDTNQGLLELELGAAVEEVKEIYGADAIKHDWGVRKDGNSISYYFIPSYAPNDASLLLIMCKDGFFVKLRCTFVDEEFMRKVCSDFVKSFTPLNS